MYPTWITLPSCTEAVKEPMWPDILANDSNVASDINIKKIEIKTFGLCCAFKKSRTGLSSQDDVFFTWFIGVTNLCVYRYS